MCLYFNNTLFSNLPHTIAPAGVSAIFTFFASCRYAPLLAPLLLPLLLGLVREGKRYLKSNQVEVAVTAGDSNSNGGNGGNSDRDSVWNGDGNCGGGGSGVAGEKRTSKTASKTAGESEGANAEVEQQARKSSAATATVASTAATPAHEEDTVLLDALLPMSAMQLMPPGAGVDAPEGGGRGLERSEDAVLLDTTVSY